MALQPPTPLLLAVVLTACSEGNAPSPASSSAPLADPGRFEGALEYLLARYDADGDGHILATEYDRTPRSFARLDRDGSGRIDARDFVGAPVRGDRKRADRATLLIGRYLQADDDLTHLDALELARGFASYDSDGDGRLGEEEFRCGQANLNQAERWLDTPQGRALLDGVDPWDGLLAGIDADGDGWITSAELLAFFETRGGGAPWTFQQEQGGAPGTPATRRPLTGLLAPDFSLRGPDGGPALTLSSFRGQRPVALVFGSYT